MPLSSIVRLTCSATVSGEPATRTSFSTQSSKFMVAGSGNVVLVPQEVDVEEPGVEGLLGFLDGLLVGGGHVNVPGQSQLGFLHVTVEATLVGVVFLPNLPVQVKMRLDVLGLVKHAAGIEAVLSNPGY